MVCQSIVGGKRWDLVGGASIKEGLAASTTRSLPCTFTGVFGRHQPKRLTFEPEAELPSFPLCVSRRSSDKQQTTDNTPGNFTPQTKPASVCTRVIKLIYPDNGVYHGLTVRELSKRTCGRCIVRTSYQPRLLSASWSLPPTLFPSSR